MQTLSTHMNLWKSAVPLPRNSSILSGVIGEFLRALRSRRSQTDRQSLSSTRPLEAWAESLQGYCSMSEEKHLKDQGIVKSLTRTSRDTGSFKENREKLTTWTTQKNSCEGSVKYSRGCARRTSGYVFWSLEAVFW